MSADRSEAGVSRTALPAIVGWFLATDSRLFALALAGGLAFIASGLPFGVDTARCSAWPGPQLGLVSTALFSLAIALMSAAWLGLLHRVGAKTSLWRIIIAAALLHALVMLVPPFLSDDGLAYGAIGASIATYGQPMYLPLGQALPASDAYAQLIIQYPEWLARGSTYGPAFNWLAAAVVGLAGDNVRLVLHLLQLVSALTLFAVAGISASAAATWTVRRDPQADGAATRRHVAALILFCPLAVIEATSSAHNDVFLALGAAAFVWFTVHGRAFPALIVLAAPLLIKLSAILLLAFHILHLLLRRTEKWRTILLGGTLLMALAAALAWMAWPLIEQSASTVVRIIDSPDRAFPFCTRSVECLPRALFHVVFDMPQVAWIIGLAFRAGGVILLLVLAIRARTQSDALCAAAAFLFFYYLFFHAYMQAWYLLSLLPLLYFLAPKWKPAAHAFMISSIAQYVLDFTLNCATDTLFGGFKEGLGLFIALAPPLGLLAFLFVRRRGRLDAAPGAGYQGRTTRET